MGVVFRRGVTVSFVAFVDVASDDWRSLVASGFGAPEARSSIEHVFNKRGRVDALTVEATPRAIGGDTTIAARVAWTPGADVLSGLLDADVLSELNKTRSSAPFRRHVSATANIVLVPVWWCAALVARFGPSSASNAYRNALGAVIDESSIAQGVDRSAPPSSSSALGRALTIAAGNERSSTDPSRNNRTPAATAASDASAAVGGAVNPPAWLVVTLVSVAGVGALVALGFAARGIAQAKREIS